MKEPILPEMIFLILMLIILTIIPLTMASSGNLETGANESINATPPFSDYLVFENANISRGLDEGGPHTPDTATWVEQSGVLGIFDGKINMNDTDDNAYFDVPLIAATVGDNYTCEWIVEHNEVSNNFLQIIHNVGAGSGGNRNLDFGYGAQCSPSHRLVMKTENTLTVNCGEMAGGQDLSQVSDTVLKLLLYVNVTGASGASANLSVYNRSVVDGVITDDMLDLVHHKLGTAIETTLSMEFTAGTTGMDLNVSSIRCWNGTNGAPPPKPLPPDILASVEALVVNITSEAGPTSPGQLVDLTDPFGHNGATIPKTNDTTLSVYIETNEAATGGIIDRNNNLNVSDIGKGSSLCSTTGGTDHECTLDTANATEAFGLHNFSFGANDSSNNQNLTGIIFFTVNITETEPPSIDIDDEVGTFFTVGINNTDIIFKGTSTDNRDERYTLTIDINRSVIYTNTSYLNGTEFKVVFDRNIGNYNISLNVTDTSNNKNSTGFLFEVQNDDVPPSLIVYAPPNNSVYVFGINTSFNSTFLATDNLNTTFKIEIWRNGTAIYTNSSYVGGTNQTVLLEIDVIGFWNLSVVANDSYDNLNISSVLIQVNNATVGLLQERFNNFTFNISETYAPNWTRIDDQLNFSVDAIIAGNFTWNFTEYNISHFVFNQTEFGNTTPWMFNVTNDGTFYNLSVLFRQNQTKPWYQLHCGPEHINITNMSVILFNLTAGVSQQFNCTLDVINITQTRINWNLTKDEANWDFNYTIGFKT